MSYHIYTTKAVVLSERPRREADRLYTLLTRDLGLVRATAGGVRKEVSKLRGNLEPFSVTTVSLVKGKGDWRITSASLLEVISEDKKILKAYAQVFSLLEKLVAGEERHPEIYDIIEGARELKHGDDLETLEIWLVSKILFELGYLTRESLPNSFEDIKKDKKQFVKAINEGLKESDLTDQ